MTTDDACVVCSRMWERIGKQARRIAFKRLEEEDRLGALAWAKFAEGCFWQSGGEADCFDLPRDKAPE
jgi:hypothetical protein